MSVQILILGAAGVIILLLWRIFNVLVRTGRNQCDQATLVMQELELIRAGMLAITKAEKQEGWPEFDKLSRCIVRDYIRPERMARTLRAEGRTQREINGW